MTAEEYIDQQCDEFEKKILSMGVSEKFKYTCENVHLLDSLKLALWGPAGPSEDEIGPLSIMWGSAFTKIIANTYESQWTADPESNVPVVIVNCGGKGMQIKSIVVATQAFRENQSLSAMWQELEEHLSKSGAKKR
ncbi:MAG: hypothetical protein NE328_00715 [Lentisphaeraceae bacterium]|nr:hypothetical protein [Lentisphaeraceae bacterium]